jgi:integrase
MDELPPYVSSYRDRHGKPRWRFRYKGKSRPLPDPDDPTFAEAYSAAVEGREPRRATVHRLPTAAAPRSLRAAWKVAQSSADFLEMKPISKAQQTGVAERFLCRPVTDDPKETLTYGDLPVAGMTRRDVKAILSRYADTPHAAWHVLRILRKITLAALDEEWIETDPTFRVKYRPTTKGWRAWKPVELERFRARWPTGTTPRLVFALALRHGHRRGDLAIIRWDEIEGDQLTHEQNKTGVELTLPTTNDELAACLEAAERRGETIITTAYGKPFSEKSLTGRMADWTRSAGLEPGCTLHGLRKTLGKALAEGGATTRQLMDVLGHKSMQHAELYSREAEQGKMARAGLKLIDGGKG